MTLRHITIFVTVADCGKMHEAAQKLHIAQPSVSQAIKELEEYYGIHLFERIGRRIYITQEGKDLLPYARHVVDSFQKMEEVAFHGLMKNSIRIGGSVSVGTVLLPDMLQKLEKMLPDLDLHVTVDNTATIEKMVIDNELDLAVVEGNVVSERLVQENIKDDQLILIAGQNHPLYQANHILLKDLNGQDFISRESGSAERNQFEQYLQEHQVQMKLKWSCSNTAAILQAVRNGEGLAIVSEMLVRQEIANKEFKALEIQGVKMNRKIKLIYYQNKFMTPAMSAFLDICESLECL